MQNENKNTLDYLNNTLNKYLDFLKVKSNDSNEVRPIRINVDIGKALFSTFNENEISSFILILDFLSDTSKNTTSLIL